MRYEELLERVGDEPVYETGLLLTGNVDPADVRRQLSRWVSAGRVYQLQRGLYMLAPPYQKRKPHSFLVANRMKTGSYVSCQSALAYYGLIPEYTPITVSVTTQRPGRQETVLGQFEFRHIKPDFFYGYRWCEVVLEQWAFVASPEKALLDLAYLTPWVEDSNYLRALRLQNLEQLDQAELHRLATLAGSPKLMRVVDQVALLMNEEEAFELL